MTMNIPYSRNKNNLHVVNVFDFMRRSRISTFQLMRWLWIFFVFVYWNEHWHKMSEVRQEDRSAFSSTYIISLIYTPL